MILAAMSSEIGTEDQKLMSSPSSRSSQGRKVDIGLFVFVKWCAENGLASGSDGVLALAPNGPSFTSPLVADRRPVLSTAL
jgi:hypothetical protein